MEEGAADSPGGKTRMAHGSLSERPRPVTLDSSVTSAPVTIALGPTISGPHITRTLSGLEASTQHVVGQPITRTVTWQGGIETTKQSTYPYLSCSTPVSASTRSPLSSSAGGSPLLSLRLPTPAAVSGTPVILQAHSPKAAQSPKVVLRIQGVQPRALMSPSGSSAEAEAPVCSAPGFTPLARAGQPVLIQRPALRRGASFAVSTPVASPMASPLLPMASPMAASPKTILRTFGLAPGMPYPPGMGFTPVAAQMSSLKGSLGRTGSFGLGRTASAGGPGASPSPSEGVLEEEEEEDVYPRELMLFHSQAKAAKGQTTPEDAGFLLPRPGFIRSEADEARSGEAKAPKAKAPKAKAPGAAAAAARVATSKVHVTSAPAYPPGQQWQPDGAAHQVRYQGAVWQQQPQHQGGYAGYYQRGAAEWWQHHPQGHGQRQGQRGKGGDRGGAR